MKKLFAAMVVAMGLALPALAAPSATAADAAKVVTLGASMQLTGPDANLARYFRDGYQIAIDRINRQGGIRIGDETYRLALKVLDNQSNINLGMQQYAQLISRDEVNFLLGPYGSNHTLNESSVAEKYRVPMVQGGGSAQQIFERGYRYVFGTAPPAEKYFGSTVEMMTKLEPRVHTLALLTADDAFDVAVRAGTTALAKKLGIDVIVDEVYPERTPNFTSLLALVKAKAPDAILLGGHEPESLTFMREAKSLDVNARDLTSLTVGVPSHDFRAALGKDAEGVFGMTPWVISPGVARPLVRRCSAIRAAVRASLPLRAGLSCCLRGRRCRDLCLCARGRRHARSRQGARRDREERFRMPLCADPLSGEWTDRHPADRDPGPERRGRADLYRSFPQQADLSGARLGEAQMTSGL